MIAIRPRETRLPLDTVLEVIRQNPVVLKVVNRTPTDIQLQTYKVENFDIEFSRNFFYWNDTQRGEGIRLIMCPFQFAGDE